MSYHVSKPIFLTGFMGAGKTTVGQILADSLGVPFVDLDAKIVQREKRPIARIFAEDGETYFRDCETALLKEVTEWPTAIYATGGGIVVRDVNRQAMANMGCVIYLQASWETLQKRLQNSVDRPLVDPAKGWSALKSLWENRQEFYSEADIIIDTDGLSPAVVARTVACKLSDKE